MTTYDYSNRVAIVTGGTRGIGYATARLLAASGANVTITGRKPETVEPAAQDIEKEAAELAQKNGTQAGKVIGIAAHVTDPEAAAVTCQKTVETFGRLDVLVNNAGTNPAFGPVHKQSAELMTKIFQINTIGPALWITAAKEAGMGAEDTAAVVNVCSIGALSTEDYIGVYNASKAALLHLTKQMARELAPTIRINAISPGVIRTKLAEPLWKEHEEATADVIPLERIGEPDDIADAIAFLGAPSTRWMTGENLVFDGGTLVGGKGIDVGNS